MLKNILQSFLPWILYFILIGNTQSQFDIAIITAVIAAIIFEKQSLKKGFILSWGTLVFFVCMFIAVVLFRNQWIVKHAGILSNGALALIIWISVLIGRPFTLQYAKEKISKDKWQNPLFIKINYILTTVWGLSLSLSTLLNVLQIYNPTFNGWIYESLSSAVTIFAIWFTVWFPAWYRKQQQEKIHAG